MDRSTEGGVDHLIDAARGRPDRLRRTGTRLDRLAAGSFPPYRRSGGRPDGEIMHIARKTLATDAVASLMVFRAAPVEVVR